MKLQPSCSELRRDQKNILLCPSCSELIMRLPFKKSTKKEEVLKDLAKIGITEKRILYKKFYQGWGWAHNDSSNFIMDKDNPNTPDFMNHSHIRLSKQDNRWSLEGHQHCQHQIFPTFWKLQREYQIDDSDIQSNGGSTEDYIDWKDDGAKRVPNYNQCCLCNGTLKDANVIRCLNCERIVCNKCKDKIIKVNDTTFCSEKCKKKYVIEQL